MVTATASATGRPAPPRPGGPPLLRVAEYHATLHRRLSWRGTVLTMLVGPVLYLLAMGVGVGSLIDENRSGALEGVRYLDFVAPGLMAAAAMQTAVAQSLYPVLGSVKWMKTAYGVAATPIRPADMALGLQAWLLVLFLAGATSFLVVATVAGAVASPLAVLAPPVAALGGLAYSSGAAAWAISRDSEQSFMPIIRLGILPSFLLSGTFFPIDQLPDAVAAVAVVTPLWHSVSLIRGLTGGTIGLVAAMGHLAVLAAYSSVGLVAATRAYRARLYA